MLQKQENPMIAHMADASSGRIHNAMVQKTRPPIRNNGQIRSVK
jgi:hypothetical protein